MDKLYLFGILGIILVVLIVVFFSNHEGSEKLEDTNKYKPDSGDIAMKSCDRCFCGDNSCCGMVDPPYESNELIKYDIDNGYVQPIKKKVI